MSLGGFLNDGLMGMSLAGAFAVVSGLKGHQIRTCMDFTISGALFVIVVGHNLYPYFGKTSSSTYPSFCEVLADLCW